jgi:hypothetical protein
LTVVSAASALTDMTMAANKISANFLNFSSRNLVFSLYWTGRGAARLHALCIFSRNFDIRSPFTVGWRGQT